MARRPIDRGHVQDRVAALDQARRAAARSRRGRPPRPCPARSELARHRGRRARATTSSSARAERAAAVARRCSRWRRSSATLHEAPGEHAAPEWAETARKEGLVARDALPRSRSARTPARGPVPRAAAAVPRRPGAVAGRRRALRCRPARTRRPEPPSSITSTMPPVRLPTAGSPQAAASISEIPRASKSEGNTKTSEARR